MSHPAKTPQILWPSQLYCSCITWAPARWGMNMPSLISFRCFSSFGGTSTERRRSRGEKKRISHHPKAMGVSFYTLLPELMPLIWFVYGSGTERAVLFTQQVWIISKCVCVYWGCERMVKMTLDNQKDWCNNKIDWDLIHGTASLLATDIIPKISAFRSSRSYTEPRFEFSPPLSFQSSVAEMSNRGDVGSLAHPYLDEKPLQVPESPQTQIARKGVELLKVNKLAVGFFYVGFKFVGFH